MRNSPVVLFVYNRLEKTKRCIECLERCPEAKDTDLYIFSDGPKAGSKNEVLSVRTYLDEYIAKSRFNNVILIKSEVNKGLAASVIDGVSKVINEYGKVIVVEDDLIVAKDFLIYMNEALKYYEDKPQYGSISAFTYPIKELENYSADIFVTRKAECWGWGTWTDRWANAKWQDTDFRKYLQNRKQRIEFEKLEAGLDKLMYLQYQGEIDSWAVRWLFYLFTNELYTVYPAKSRVYNDGFDGSGTHGKTIKKTDVDSLSDNSIRDESPPVSWKDERIDKNIEKAYARFPRKWFPIYILETFRNLMRQ